MEQKGGETVRKKKILFDFGLLCGRIVERFGTRKNFADAAGIGLNTLSSRLNNKSSFSPDEVVRFSQPDLLDIPGERIHLYFFTPKF